MKISQAMRAIRLSHTSRRPVFLWGQPGAGKSDVVFQAAEQCSQGGGVVQYHELRDVEFDPGSAFGLHDVRLSQCEPVDIRGLPVPDLSNNTTKWLPPDWLPHTSRDDIPDQGILFLDEANSAPPSVQAAAYQLVLDRRIGDYSLKPGWSIVLAGNRLTDGGVTFKMPKPLANRMIHLEVEVDVEEWTSWAIDHELPLSMIAFVRLRPDLLNTFEDHVKKKLEGEAFATPRTWHIAAGIVDLNPSLDIMIEMLNGTVGKGPAAEYFGFMQVWQKMPNIDGILLDPKGSPVPKDAATMYAVATALANRATPDNMDAVCAYLDRVQPEFSVLTMKDTQRRNPKCMTTKAFVRWANANAGLLG